MAGAFNGSTDNSTQSESFSGNNNEGGSFECNICFELAQDPIVTLCGHLYCWPCLFKWLHIHSHSKECPVCKAMIEEEKLVPLYGRGKNNTDPRSKSIPGVEIPHRPTGQRPETAPTPNPDHFSRPGFGFMGGFTPIASARLGNFSFSAGFGGFFPSLFNMHFHTFPDIPSYGTTAGFPHGFSNSFNVSHTHGFQPRTSTPGQQADNFLSMLLIVIGLCVIFTLVYA